MPLCHQVMNWESNLETASSPQDSISMQRVNIMRKVCLHFREMMRRGGSLKFKDTTILWVFYFLPINIEGLKETNAGSTRGALIGPFTQHNPELWNGNRWYILFGALIMSWQSPENWLSNTGQKTLISLIYSAELRPDDDAVWLRGETFPPGVFVSICCQYFFSKNQSLSGAKYSV